MAEVFEARLLGAEGFSRPVAVKRVARHLSADPAFGRMFVNEARIASLLLHANIVSVLDFDRDSEGRYYLVMELVRGVDLRELERSGPLPPAVSTFVIGEILKGLAYAHDREVDGQPLGIVHRDVTPHNVMVSWDGAVKLLDFGIAKAFSVSAISVQGTIKGKIGYLSPEQARLEPLDGRSDVFCAGIVFHELLTGQRLFRGDNEQEILSRILHQPIPPATVVRPEVPADVSAVCARMLERDPAARFPSAHAALDALLQCYSYGPRAELELRALVRERFADRAPPRRAASAGGPLLAPAGGTLDSRYVVPEPGGATPAGTGMPGDRGRGAAGMPGDHGRGATGMPGDRGGSTTTPGHGGARGGVPAVAFGSASPTPAAVSTITADTPSGAPAPAIPAPARGGSWASRRATLIAVALIVVVAIAGGLVVFSPGDADRSTPDATAMAHPADAASAPRASAVTPADAAGGVAPETDAAIDAAIDAVGDHAGQAQNRPAGREGRPREPRRTPPETTAEQPGTAAPPGRPGRVTFAVSPWAIVWIDGKERGKTPITVPLAPGKHTIRLHNDVLGEDETFMIEVAPSRPQWIRRRW